MSPTSNPMDYFAIQNTLSRYTMALDSKDFDALQEVFTEKIDAKYPFAQVTTTKELISEIHKRLQHVTTQHALTTQTIEVAKDGKSADAITYFTGLHFGTGKWEGQALTVWGKYTDHLVLAPGAEALPSVNGRWLIERREVGFMGRAGEGAVMAGE